PAIPLSAVPSVSAQNHARHAHTNASPPEPWPSSAQRNKPAIPRSDPPDHPPLAPKTSAASVQSPEYPDSNRASFRQATDAPDTAPPQNPAGSFLCPP